MMHLLDAEVEAAWIDYNGHMNDGYYAVLLSRAGDAFMASMGLDAARRDADRITIYTLSMLIHYLKEAKRGEPLTVFGRLLEHDAKRVRFWLELRRANDVLALSEQLLICIDQSGAAPRPAPFPGDMQARMAAVHAEHARLPAPERAGKGISLTRPR